jgi:hypothetical protein
MGYFREIYKADLAPQTTPEDLAAQGFATLGFIPGQNQEAKRLWYIPSSQFGPMSPIATCWYEISTNDATINLLAFKSPDLLMQLRDLLVNQLDQPNVQQIKSIVGRMTQSQPTETMVSVPFWTHPDPGKPDPHGLYLPGAKLPVTLSADGTRLQILNAQHVSAGAYSAACTLDSLYLQNE